MYSCCVLASESRSCINTCWQQIRAKQITGDCIKSLYKHRYCIWWLIQWHFGLIKIKFCCNNTNDIAVQKWKCTGRGLKRAASPVVDREHDVHITLLTHSPQLPAKLKPPVGHWLSSDLIFFFTFFSHSSLHPSVSLWVFVSLTLYVTLLFPVIPIIISAFFVSSLNFTGNQSDRWELC